MDRKSLFGALLLSVILLSPAACREDTEPPARYNENLAQAGQPALLPLTPHEYSKDIRGRLNRMDRETREAGSAGGEGDAGAASPDVADVTALVEDYNRLVRGGDFAAVSELIVADQQSAALTYWSQLGELSIAMRDAVSQTMEAAGATRPELMPQVESLKGTIDQITVRGIVAPQVQVSGDEATITLESPPPPGLGAPDASAVKARRGPDGWLLVAAIPADGDADTWAAPLRLALGEVESAVDAFDSAQIDVEAMVKRLTSAATAVLNGTEPVAEEAPADAADETQAPDDQPAAPAAPPSGTGPGGLVP